MKNSNSIRLILIILVAGCLLAACDSEHGEPMNSESAKSLAISKLLEVPDEIVFQDVQELVLESSCVQCHSTDRLEANVDVTSYENLVSGTSFKKILFPFDPLRSDLFNSLVAKGDRLMPPKDKAQLSEDQKTLVFAWINSGAKKTKNSVPARPPSLKEELQVYFDDPALIDFEVVNSKVFESKCNSCHSSNSKSPNEDAIWYSGDFTNYQTTVADFPLVVVNGKPNDSPLFSSVAMDQTMPPEEDGYDLLDPQLAKILRLWILNCAIEKYDANDPNIIDGSEGEEKVRLCDGQ